MLYVLTLVCMYTDLPTTYTSGTLGGQKRVLGPLGLELYTVVSHSVGVET